MTSSLHSQLRHCITLQDYSAQTVRGVLQLAAEIKAAPEEYERALEDRWLLMLFQKTSTRTRLSYELGMQQLGGRTVMLDWDATNFAISPLRFEAQYVSRHVDLIMARLKRHEDLLALAQHATVPVINGCDERFHPSQALADLLTVQETAGGFLGQTLTYVGIHNNVANSLVHGCTRVGLKLILVTPEVNPPAYDAQTLDALEREGHIERTLDLPAAVRRSDFVYTDTWVDMEFFSDPAFAEEKRKREAALRPYQLNAALLAGSQAKILHDMPIHPGFEIEEALVDDPRSLIYQQAENRLYVQQALMLFLIEGLPS